MNRKVAFLSFIAALLVIGSHIAEPPEPATSVWWFEQLAHYGVCLCAVPFFFVCSGYFLARHIDEEAWHKRECFKRMKSLLVPFAIWSLIYLAMKIPFGYPTDAVSLLQAVGIYPFDYPYLYPLWYVRTLFVFVLVSPMILFALRRLGAAIYFPLLFALALYAGIGFGNELMTEFFRKTFALDSLMYFSLGMYLRTRPMKVPRQAFGYAALCLGLALLVATSAAALSLGETHRWARLLFVPPILFGAWTIMPERKLPRIFEGVSFPLYLLHLPVLLALAPISLASDKSLLLWALKYALAFTLTLALAKLIKRYLPRFAALAFGGR